MTHHITITIPIDPTLYADVEDTVQDAMLVANEIIYRAADLPNDVTIRISQSNEQIVQVMEALLRTFIGNDIKHEELPSIKEVARLTLINLEQNRQLTKEAREI